MRRAIWSGASLVLLFGCATGKNLEATGGAGGVSATHTTGASTSGVGTGSTTSAATSGVTSSVATTSVSSSASTTSSSVSSSSASSSGVTSSSVSSASSSTATASSSGSGMSCPNPPTMVLGCSSCGAFCDSPWNVSWAGDATATYYIVEYACLLTHQYQTTNTMADLCMEVGMCNDGGCGFGAGMVTVQACNASCCSAKVTVDPNETPIACGGGVCC